MSITAWIVITLVVVIICIIIQIITSNKRRDDIDGILQDIPNFSTTHLYIGPDEKTGIAIDEENRKVCFIQNYYGVVINPFDYKDIISSEVIEDGDTITKSSRTSQIGGALVGGLALGGVGAIIGGLSGSKKTSGVAKNISLKVIVNDTSSAMHEVIFLNTEAKKDSLSYKIATEKVNEWHAKIHALIKQSNTNFEQKPKAPTETDSRPEETAKASVVDQIAKLAELKEKGFLTDEEFNTQKQKLLSE